MSGVAAESADVSRSRGRVCHLTSVHRVNDIRVFHKECATLAEAGFDVTLIGVAADTPERGVKIITLPDEGNRLQRIVGRARAAYRQAIGVGAQIYHFHDPELLPYGLMLKKRTGAKLIFDSHECFREDVVGKHWIPAPLRPVVGHVVGGIEDFVVRRIDQVVAATPHIAESFERQARRVVTINNYPLEAEFAASAQTTSGRRDGICYVGAISFVRGVIPLLDALSFIDSSVRVDIAGPFAGKAVEDAARSHANWGRVTYHGQVSRAQVAEIYAGAFAGIVNFLPVPNHIFSQPNKLFEYMSAGVPVICSHFPLWRSVIEDEGCGIAVDPALPQAIAAAIEALRSEPSRSADMAKRGVQLVRDKYNWSCEGRKLIETYDALLG
jgi:glycosyltransferase involved in cell wall biosynthesis